MRDEPRKAITLDDVASIAGVSPATVSRFLNNPQIVAAKTGERIRAAIGETDYIPNALAGGLASKRSRMVAVLIPHLVDSFFSVTIETMVDELNKNGTTVMLGLTNLEQERTQDLVRAAISRKVDAVIATGPVDEATTGMVCRSDTLLIQIWDLPKSPQGVAIGFSHAEAGRDIARFLVSRGYRNPYLVTSDGERARARRDALVEEWVALGGEPPRETIVPIPATFGQARRVFADLRRMAKLPDVVVCGSDQLAQGIIVEAQAAGLKVPDELAVMGFGNSAIAGEMRPTITSVEVDGPRIAREAMAAIRRHSEGALGDDQRRVDVGFRLVARESA